jgi:hypothetical protein
MLNISIIIAICVNNLTKNESKFQFECIQVVIKRVLVCTLADKRRVKESARAHMRYCINGQILIACMALETTKYCPHNSIKAKRK